MDNASSDATVFSREHFQQFAELMLKRCGLLFDENKFPVVKNAVRERMRAIAIPDIDSYLKFIIGTGSLTPEVLIEDILRQGTNYLRSPGEREFRRLVELLTVNETQFFRNKEHFRAVRDTIIPQIIENHQSDRTIRIWSAGCSTGQEPYSLAITLLEELRRRNYKLDGQDGWKVTIYATDISERALRIAYTGRYRNEDLRLVEPEVVDRYFLAPTSAHVQTAPLDPNQILSPGRAPLARGIDRSIYQVKPEVKDLIKFGYFNLAAPNYPPDRFNNFDLVLCENVTIYFTPQVTQQVIENLFKSMRPGGFLFIGYSETLWQISNQFRLVNSHDTFYYQRPGVGELPGNRPTTDKLRNPVEPLPPINPARITDKIPVVKESTPPPPPRIPLIKPVPGLKPPLINPKTEVTGGGLKWAEALQEGLKLMVQHEFENARFFLQRALETGKNQPKVLVAMAQLQTKLGAYAEASEYSRKAIAIDPLCEEAHLILAMIHHSEGRIEESIAEFQKTIYINIDSIIAHLRLGDIYRSLGQVSNALREYRSALSAMEKRPPNEIVEDLPVELLKQTCEQNIRLLRR